MLPVGDPQPMALEPRQWLGFGLGGIWVGVCRCCGWGTLSPWLWLALGWDAGDAEDGSLLPCSFGADVEVGIRLGGIWVGVFEVQWVGDPQPMALEAR